jgi:hypothetical protein
MEDRGTLVAHCHYTDSKGVHTRTESGWKEVAAGGEKSAFLSQG